ncbi:OsmC family protein [Pedobacter xixiisoli]|uniref:Organic hydroperoxide reductase OsmC/OhrA n=1 Tax=Pedobacter xixiisoli TaxID=1476464 RepID=A0A286AAP9_9SPHI|nr:OsmC family protein [Pedobacter xixiisoli]SOD18984.1 Organic hydroperoxide reductase OsmC/OhrA [Pedobacter xixiisoli]
MPLKHLFKAILNWQTDRNSVKRYIKNHTVSFEDKSDLKISAAKAFKGDPSLHNPEDLLLSSLMSCHMMSFLYVCSLHQINVLSYTDSATGTLETDQKGSGRFTEVHLHPVVTIDNPKQIELANSLHQKANKLCFIANSCNFKILHTATCTAG